MAAIDSRGISDESRHETSLERPGTAAARVPALTFTNVSHGYLREHSCWFDSRTSH